MMNAELSYHDLYWKIPKIEKHVELTYLADEEEITDECKAEIIGFLLSQLQYSTKNAYLHIGLDNEIDYSDFEILLDDDQYYRDLAEDDPVNCGFTEA